MLYYKKQLTLLTEDISVGDILVWAQGIYRKLWKMWCMQFNILISLLDILKALTWYLTWEMKRYNILVVLAANQTKFAPSVMFLGAICNNSTSSCTTYIEVINSCQNQVWKAAVYVPHRQVQPKSGWLRIFTMMLLSICGIFSTPTAPWRTMYEGVGKRENNHWPYNMKPVIAPIMANKIKFHLLWGWGWFYWKTFTVFLNLNILKKIYFFLKIYYHTHCIYH